MKDKIIFVETVYYDSDNYKVNTVTVPCRDEETARALVKKMYEKILEDCFFGHKEEAKEWEKEQVTFEKNGSIHIQGGDCGFASITIIEKELLSLNEVDNYNVEVFGFY